MEDFSKEMAYGNFLDFDRFPLDCESIAMMQSTLRHYAAIAQIAGYDLLILSGCEVSGGFREEGYVFVKKNGTLTGEILFHPTHWARGFWFACAHRSTDTSYSFGRYRGHPSPIGLRKGHFVLLYVFFGNPLRG